MAESPGEEPTPDQIDEEGGKENPDSKHKPKSGGSQSKGKKFTSDKPSMSEILRLKKPNTRKCVILLDSALSHEIDRVSREIEALDQQRRLKIGGSLADTQSRDMQALLDELAELESEAEDMTVEFTFQDIGRKRYDELVRENRPTEAEKQEYKDAGGEGVLPYSTETFPALLVSETSIDPKITLKEAEVMFEEWAEGDLEVLFTTALLACKEPTSLPKSRAGIAKIRDSLTNSTIAPNEESPTPNS